MPQPNNSISLFMRIFETINYTFLLPLIHRRRRCCKVEGRSSKFPKLHWDPEAFCLRVIASNEKSPVLHPYPSWEMNQLQQQTTAISSIVSSFGVRGNSSQFANLTRVNSEFSCQCSGWVWSIVGSRQWNDGSTWQTDETTITCRLHLQPQHQPTCQTVWNSGKTN